MNYKEVFNLVFKIYNANNKAEEALALKKLKELIESIEEQKLSEDISDKDCQLSLLLDGILGMIDTGKKDFMLLSIDSYSQYSNQTISRP